jgi:Uma2 family endonuclease
MNAAMPDSLSPRRIDVDQYYQMAEEGLLAPEARVELIEGEIIDMPPIGSPHASKVNTLAHLFHLAVGGRARVIAQSPVRLGRFSEPQPDLALLKMRRDGYEESHPTAEDVLLIVEVSGSSLRYDRNRLPLYARHCIPEVWILDLEGRQFHFHRAPEEGRYRDVSVTASVGVCSPALVPGVEVDLTNLL